MVTAIEEILELAKGVLHQQVLPVAEALGRTDEVALNGNDENLAERPSHAIAELQVALHHHGGPESGSFLGLLPVTVARVIRRHFRAEGGQGEVGVSNGLGHFLSIQST